MLINIKSYNFTMQYLFDNIFLWLSKFQLFRYCINIFIFIFLIIFFFYRHIKYCWFDLFNIRFSNANIFFFFFWIDVKFRLWKINNHFVFFKCLYKFNLWSIKSLIWRLLKRNSLKMSLLLKLLIMLILLIVSLIIIRLGLLILSN